MATETEKTPAEKAAEAAKAAGKKRLEAKGFKVRQTRAQRRAGFEKQVGHKVGVPKGKKHKA